MFFHNGMQKIAFGVLICFCATLFPNFSYALAQQEYIVSHAFLPSDIGKVVERYTGNTNRKVYLIQTIHCHPETQTKIGAIIDAIKQKHGKDVALVGVEGSVGRIDTSLIGNIANARVKDAVQKYFLERGYLTGAEVYDIEHPRNVRLYGLEDAQLYRENFVMLYAMLETRGNVEKMIAEECRVMKRGRAVLYVPALQAFTQDEKAYRDGRMSTEMFVGVLQEKTRVYDVELNQMYPMMEILREMRRLNEQINQTTVRMEAQQCVARLKRSNNGSRNLQVAHKALANEKRGDEEWYRALKIFVEEQHVAVNDYDQLGMYLKYLEYKDQLNELRLREEIEELTYRVKEAMVRGITDTALLVKGERCVELFEKMVRNEASEQEVKWWNEKREEWGGVMHALHEKLDWKKTMQNGRGDRAKSREGESDSVGATLRVAQNSGDGNRAKKHNPLSMSHKGAPLTSPFYKGEEIAAGFYERAEKRNEVMVRNLLKQKGKVLVAVVGGYHAQGMSAILRSKGISYELIIPVITTQYERKRYDERVREQAQWLGMRHVMRGMNEKMGRVYGNVQPKFSAVGTPANRLELMSVFGMDAGREAIEAVIRRENVRLIDANVSDEMKRNLFETVPHMFGVIEMWKGLFERMRRDELTDARQKGFEEVMGPLVRYRLDGRDTIPRLLGGMLRHRERAEELHFFAELEPLVQRDDDEALKRALEERDGMALNRVNAEFKSLLDIAIEQKKWKALTVLVRHRRADSYEYLKRGLEVFMDNPGCEPCKLPPQRQFLDFVSTMVGCNMEAYLTAEAMTKCESHFHAFKGEATRTGTRLEGFWTYEFLPVHVFSLIRIFYEVLQGAWMVEGSDRDEVLMYLTSEIQTAVEVHRNYALRIGERRILESSHPAYAALISATADQMVDEVERMEDKREYVIPSGWRRYNERKREWTAHRIYIPIRKMEGHVFVRIDNLGDGIFEATIGDRHYVEGEMYLPYAYQPIPMRGLERWMPRRELEGMRGYIQKVLEGPGNEYAVVVRNVYTPDGLVRMSKEDTRRRYAGLRAQTSGNCAVENYLAGMYMRTGSGKEGMFHSVIARETGSVGEYLRLLSHPEAGAVHGPSFQPARAEGTHFDTVQIEKIHQYYEAMIQAEEHALYVPLEDEGGKALDETVDIFLGNEKKVLLIAGGIGGGKSTYTRHLMKRLWETRKAGDAIPVCVSLPSVPKEERAHIPEYILGRCGISDDGIRMLKRDRTFVFILDGYDEMNDQLNLYRANHLDEWDAKMIVTCRMQYAGGVLGRSDLFVPWKDTKGPDPVAQLLEYDYVSIGAFQKRHIEQYMEHYAAATRTRKEEYMRDIDGIPALTQLIQTPLMLWMVLQVLPALTMERRHTLTRVDVYDVYVKDWIERERKRLISIRGGEACLTYCKQFAMTLYEQGKTEIHYDRVTREPAAWRELLSKDNEDIRACCPIEKRGDEYRFIHTSFLEYFIGSKNIYDELQKEEIDDETHPTRAMIERWKKMFINAKLLTQEPAIIELLVDKIEDESHPTITKVLWGIIYGSREDEDLWVAAANAITILNAAGVSFSGMDLHGVRIRGADVRGGVFDSTDFGGADVRSMNFRQGLLRNVMFDRANMEGVEFGERAWIDVGLKESGMPAAVCSVAYLPDGKTLVTGSKCSHPLRVWDVSSGKCIREYEYERRLPCRVVYSPDGKTFATNALLDYVNIWDVSSGKNLRILEAHRGHVSSMVYSPDGKTLAMGRGEYSNIEVQLWDVSSGENLMTLRDHTSSVVTSMVYSPDGKTLAMGIAKHSNIEVQLWDVSSGKHVMTLTGHTQSVTSMVYSPDGKTLATGCMDCTVRVWDVSSGKNLRILAGHRGDVESMAYSPDGKMLATGSDDCTVRVWDVSSGKCIDILSGHTSWVMSVAYSPDGKTLATGSKDGIVRMWEVGKEQHMGLTWHIPKVESLLARMVYSPDGKILASYHLDFLMRMWDVRTGRYRDIACWAVYSPDGKTRATAEPDETVCLWDMGSQRLIAKLRNYKAWRMVYSPDGKMLAITSLDYDERERVLVWDVNGKNIRMLTGHTGKVDSVTFSPDEKTLATGSEDKTIRLWDVSTGRCISTFTGYTAFMYSPDGKTLTTRSDEDKTVQVWDVSTGRCIHTFAGHTAFMYSPDGKTLATGSEDKTIRLWDVSSGRCMSTLSGHTDLIYRLVYSPDGKTLATESYGRVRVWDVSTGRCWSILRGHDVVYSPDGRTLATESDEGAIQHWDISGIREGKPARVLWSRGHPLVLTGASIVGVTGLSDENRRMMLQRGALEMPLKEYMRRGNTYYSESRYDEAIRDYSLVLGTDPDNADAYNMRAYSHICRGEYGKAINDFEYAIANASEDEKGNFYDSLGEGYIFFGDRAKAQASLQEAIRRGEHATWRAESEAKLLYAEGKYAEVKKRFHELVKQNRRALNFLYFMGKCNEALGDSEGARWYYREALKISKGNYVPAQQALDKLEHSEKHDEAAHALRGASLTTFLRNYNPIALSSTMLAHLVQRVHGTEKVITSIEQRVKTQGWEIEYEDYERTGEKSDEAHIWTERRRDGKTYLCVTKKMVDVLTALHRVLPREKYELIMDEIMKHEALEYTYVFKDGIPSEAAHEKALASARPELHEFLALLPLFEQLLDVQTLRDREALAAMWSSIHAARESVARLKGSEVQGLELVNACPNLVKALEQGATERGIIEREVNTGELFEAYAEEIAQFRRDALYASQELSGELRVESRQREELVLFSDGIVLWRKLDGELIVDSRIIEGPVGEEKEIGEMKWVQREIEQGVQTLTREEQMSRTVREGIIAVFSRREEYAFTGCEVRMVRATLQAA